jgi:hypothetical protein
MIKDQIKQLAIDIVQYSEDFYEYDFYNNLKDLYDNNRQLLIDEIEAQIITNKARVLQLLENDKHTMFITNDSDRAIYEQLCNLINRLVSIPQ